MRAAKANAENATGVNTTMEAVKAAALAAAENA